MSGEPMDRLGQRYSERERERMVESQLRARSIRDERVLDAMRRIPREHFVPEPVIGRSYEDSALPIESGQTISQPYMVARMTELCELSPDDNVLEIGTGSGYQTAVLCMLARHVYSVEWHLPLMTLAAQRLESLGLRNASLRCGDGSLGWPEHAPYPAILVTAGAPAIPPALREQLTVGGRLVIPVGPSDDQTLVRVWRTADGFREEPILSCRFVKLQGAEGWRES